MTTISIRRLMPMGLMRLLPVCGAWLLAAAIQAQTLDTVTAQGRPLVQDFAQSSLIIDTSGQACEHFGIFIASERNAQARGLMFVREMPADVGMLFIHPSERMISMWMRNTLIPLDMVFMDSSGVVIHIAENTVPGSLDSISSMQPALAVLEINGGLAARLGIQPGDLVRHPYFGSL